MGRDLDKPISDLGYTTKEIADRLNVCDRTIKRWRRSGYGPPFIYVGERVFYPFVEYYAWVAERFGDLRVSTLV